MSCSTRHFACCDAARAECRAAAEARCRHGHRTCGVRRSFLLLVASALLGVASAAQACYINGKIFCDDNFSGAIDGGDSTRDGVVVKVTSLTAMPGAMFLDTSGDAIPVGPAVPGLYRINLPGRTDDYRVELTGAGVPPSASVLIPPSGAYGTPPVAAIHINPGDPVLNHADGVNFLLAQCQPPRCGDGRVNAPGETCEPPGSPQPSGQLCRDDCTFCGDGLANDGEQCDGTDDAACPVACSPTCTCAVCGNNIAEGPEQCDGTDDAACPGQCLPPGGPRECTCPVCGDNVVQPPEQCDGTDDAVCPGLCLPPGDPNECECAVGCGNGIVEPPETCDPPGSPAGASGNPCRVNCTVCGDGVIQSADGESCDDGNNLECDPTHPQKALDACNNACAGLFCKDPARITLRDGLDVLQFHGRMVPIDGRAMDFGSSDVSISLTTAQDRVFEASVPAGAIEGRTRTFRYRHAAAKQDGGIYKLRTVLGGDGTYRVTVTAYGDLGGAVAGMVTHMTIGGREWTVHGLWSRTGSGWVFNGRNLLP